MYKELFNLPCSKSSFDQVNGLLLFEIFTCFVLHMMVFQFSAELATICNSPHRNLMEKAVGCCGPLAPLDSWFIWSSIWVLFWKVPLSHFSSILAEIFYNPVSKKCTQIMADIYLCQMYTVQLRPFACKHCQLQKPVLAWAFGCQCPNLGIHHAHIKQYA